MKFCPKCGAQLDDAAGFCPTCGFSFANPQQAPQMQGYAAVPAHDHTAEFSAQEVSEGKVFALAIYLLGIAGIVVALLGSRDNKYVAFHIRTYLKIQICLIIGVVACIIPIVGWFAYGVWAIILAVLEIICFFNVCGGKAIDPAIIRGMGFLK